MAAGLRIEEGKLEAFRTAFCEMAAAEIKPPAARGRPEDRRRSPLSAFTLQAVHEIERLAPFGDHNARPLLCTSGATLVGAAADGQRRTAPVDEAFAARRDLSGGRLWRRRMGRRLDALAGRSTWPFAPSSIPSGRQNVELHSVDWR